MSSTSSTARRVADTLLEYKNTLQQELKKLARSKGELKKFLPRGYVFQEAGSFWSPLLQDVTDVDLLFFPGDGSCPAAMPLQHAESLRSAAARVLEVTLKYRIVTAGPGGCDIEEEHEDWASCLRAMQVRVSHLPVTLVSVDLLDLPGQAPPTCAVLLLRAGDLMPVHLVGDPRKRVVFTRWCARTSVGR